MEVYFIILCVVAIIAILLLIFFISYNKIKKYKDKMVRCESIIDDKLNEKLEIITNMNSVIKKATNKKDYLKEYILLDKTNITNIEKDMKLDEAEKLINEISLDHSNLVKNKDYKKNVESLKKINETLYGSKNMYNQNAILSNQFIKKFPNNIVSKLIRFRTHTIYNSNKTDGEEF